MNEETIQKGKQQFPIVDIRTIRDENGKPIDIITKDNYITKNLGYTGNTMSSGEYACGSITNCADDKISWLIFEYGTAETPNVAMVHQQHGETTTKQTIFFGNHVSERTITFTNSQRSEIQNIGDWSTVTSLFGVQATANNVVLRLLNHLLTNSAGLYYLTIPSVTTTTAGLITPQQLGSLINSSSVRTVWVGTEQEYEAIATKDTNTEYNIIESV